LHISFFSFSLSKLGKSFAKTYLRQLFFKTFLESSSDWQQIDKKKVEGQAYLDAFILKTAQILG